MRATQILTPTDETECFNFEDISVVVNNFQIVDEIVNISNGDEEDQKSQLQFGCGHHHQCVVLLFAVVPLLLSSAIHHFNRSVTFYIMAGQIM